MTTRFKTSLAAGVAALTLAVAVPTLTAIGPSSARATADKTEARQDQQPQQRRQGPPPGGPGMRRPGGPMGPMGFGPGFAQLDLSDDQRAQLKQIAESHRDEFRAAGEKARAAHDGMQALLESDSIDENAIRAKSTEIAAAEAEVMILNAKVRRESMQVLTPEQQTKLKELRDSHPGPMQRRPRGQ